MDEIILNHRLQYELDNRRLKILLRTFHQSLKLLLVTKFKELHILFAVVRYYLQRLAMRLNRILDGMTGVMDGDLDIRKVTAML